MASVSPAAARSPAPARPRARARARARPRPPARPRARPPARARRFRWWYRPGDDVLPRTTAILTLTISGSAPIHLVADHLAGRAVSLSVTAYSATAATPDLGPLPLSAHQEGGLDDMFEVVP